MILGAGCAHQGIVPSAQSKAPALDGAPEAGLQTLFRVRYQGTDGRGRIKITTRVAGREHFQLAAADSFGRQHWSLEYRPGRTLFLDHRERRVCLFTGDVVLPAIALAELPVSLLPRVLAGELPVRLPAGIVAVPGGAAVHWPGEGTREWSVALDSEGRVARWTLWVDGEPLLWFRAERNGGMLSHRRGAQVVWSRVTQEPLAQELTPLVTPSGYARGSCDDPDLP
jgi:hypothetical protein